MFPYAVPATVSWLSVSGIFRTETTAPEMLRMHGISSLMWRAAVCGWMCIAKSWLQYY